MLKKFRIGLPFLALVLGVAASAFTGKVKQSSLEQRWFYTEETTAGENDPSNYEKLSGQDALCPGNSAVYCVIEAPEHLNSMGQPDGTPDLTNITVISRKP